MDNHFFLLEQLDMVAANSNKLTPTTEWDLLKQKHPDLIVKYELPPADPNAYMYQYHDHELTRHVRQGVLERVERNVFFLSLFFLFILF